MGFLCPKLSNSTYKVYSCTLQCISLLKSQKLKPTKYTSFWENTSPPAIIYTMSPTCFRSLRNSLASYLKLLDGGPQGPKHVADILQTVRDFSVHRFYFDCFNFCHLIQLDFGDHSKADGTQPLQAAPTHKAYVQMASAQSTKYNLYSCIQ